jgi:predicted RNA-binding protein YlqC (UPF0109 family)
MKELVLLITKALVDNPDQVEVKEIAGEKATVLELKVADGDRGKIIGKEGRIIKAKGNKNYCEFCLRKT